MEMFDHFSRMDMKLRLFLRVLLLAGSLSVAGISCAPVPGKSISLGSFTENRVEVSIYLERNSAGNTLLSARFTPPEGYHLYSKDIPLTGANGLGRPTLLELTPDSQLKATGPLAESVGAQKPDFDPRELLVYPAGPVTLSLPIALPPGDGWINDEIKITFMTCSAVQCKPPVEGKNISIRIPGADVFDNQ